MECKEADCLPQVLVMENVPGVQSSKFEKPWAEWQDALFKMGYTSYHKILNAKDYGIPQNRRRCFMVSILGKTSYTFPKKVPLRYLLKDFIYKKVDESYYLSDDVIEMFEEHARKNTDKGNGLRFDPKNGDMTGSTVTEKEGQRNDDNFIKSSYDQYNHSFDEYPETSKLIQPRHDVPNHGERLIVDEDAPF